jgi:proton-dependent oligopeptide transporter, POT family
LPNSFQISKFKGEKLMSVAIDEQGPKGNRGFFGHPWGLSTLFFTEMWERLSYYGMRAILVLYMTAELSKGGLAYDTKKAAAIYGLYTSSVYFLPLIGGWIADRFIGAKRATLIGGVIITLGHFLLAFPPESFFYAGLICVAIGTGFLKANISKMVGDLYTAEDQRRDAGFSIFYMGINIGAFLAPFVCGTLAVYNWHWGFAAAGVGMALGIIQYLVGYRNLRGVGEPPVKFENERTASSANPVYLIQMIVLVLITGGVIYFTGRPEVSEFVKANFQGTIGGAILNYYVNHSLMPTLLVAGLVAVLLTGMQDKLSADDWKRLAIIGVLFIFSMIFWMGFEQAGSSLTLFAEQITNRQITPTWELPTAWLQAVNPLFIIGFAPVFAALWLYLGKRQPSESIKFSLGLLFSGLGFAVLAYAASLSGAGKVSPWWLVLVYLFHTFGELCLSPVGLSAMTKLAPGKMVSLMLGVWFLSISMGSYIGGIVAGEFEAKQDVLVGLFTKVTVVTLVGALILFAISPFVKKLYSKPEAVVPTEPA